MKHLVYSDLVDKQAHINQKNKLKNKAIIEFADTKLAEVIKVVGALVGALIGALVGDASLGGWMTSTTAPVAVATEVFNEVVPREIVAEACESVKPMYFMVTLYFTANKRRLLDICVIVTTILLPLKPLSCCAFALMMASCFFTISSERGCE